MLEKLMNLRGVIDKVLGGHPALSPPTPTVSSVDSGLSQLSLQQTNSDASLVQERMRRPAPLITPTHTPEMMAKEQSRSPTQMLPGTRQSPPALRGLRLETSDNRTTAGPGPSLTPPPQQQLQSPRRIHSGKNLPSLETTAEIEGSRPAYRRSLSDGEFPTLPPSAWGGDEDAIRPVKPNQRAKTDDISLTPNFDPEPVKFERSKSTVIQQDAFEKVLFKNSAILCDL